MPNMFKVKNKDVRRFTGSYIQLWTTAWNVSVFWDFLVQMRENKDQKNSEYGHFLYSQY